ncbi:MAG: FadR/GntR family transcriptional regulator [Blastocatellia bacterium]
MVRETTLTERTERQVEELILDCSLKVGDRLPPERELSQQLGVSKTVVREAVKSLAARGLIEVRAGSGMYVRGVSSEMMRDPMNLLLRSRQLSADDILEVREVLEVKMAELAAERARAQEIEVMEEAIRALHKRNISAAEFAEADVSFHRGVALAAGNPLFLVLANSINDVMMEVRTRAFNLDGAAVSVEMAALFHLKILDRIKAHDVEGARQAMQEHLAEAGNTLRRANGSGLAPRLALK